MADIIWTDVVAFAPELSTIAAGAQTDILAHVNDTLVVTEFGGETAAKTRLARIYLAAHFGTVTAQGAAGAAGPVVSETVDRLSRTYGQPYGGGAAPDSLDSTSYGKAFRALVRTTPARIPMLL